MIEIINSDAATLTRLTKTHKRPLLSLAECALVSFIFAISLLCMLYVKVRHQAVDWRDFLPDISVALELILVGIFIRKSKYLPRLATCIIAFGLTVCFLVACGILTMTILPFANPMVVRELLLADAAIGFSWVDSVNYLAGFPRFGIALHFVYLSILPQVAFVIVLLAFLRRDLQLHRFLTVFFLSMTATSAVWWLFPSVGPAAYGMVTEAVQQKILLVANAEYGAKMWRYATQGNLIISKSEMAGVIAFPSMHIVMTCMAVWFSWRTWAFVPLLGLNLAMPVATVLQGGHHVMDIFGGILVFGACVFCANQLIPTRASLEISLQL
jgi:hypothetical protein